MLSLPLFIPSVHLEATSRMGLAQQKKGPWEIEKIQFVLPTRRGL